MSFLINESRRLCGIPQYYSTDCGRSKYGDGIFRQRDRDAAGKLMDIYVMYYIHEDEIGSVAFDVWVIHNNWSPDGVWSDREYCEIPVDRAWVSAWAETEGDVLSAKDLDFTLGMSWDTNYVYTYIAKGLIHRAFSRENAVCAARPQVFFRQPPFPMARPTRYSARFAAMDTRMVRIRRICGICTQKSYIRRS